jgi:hypothetical protein
VLVAISLKLKKTEEEESFEKSTSLNSDVMPNKN